MELDEFGKDFPITLANYHSATVYSVPLTSLRTEPIYEEDYPDYGGSGVYLDRIDGDKVKLYKLKDDCLDGSPFYPKCCALPLALADQERAKQSSGFKYETTYTNAMVYDDELDALLIADPVTNKIDLQRLERGEGEEDSSLAYKTSLVKLSFGDASLISSNAGQISQMIPTFTQNEQRVFFVRQPNEITLVRATTICEGKMTLDKLTSLDVAKGKGSRRSKRKDSPFPSDSPLYWKISQSNLLKNHLAIGLNHNDSISLLDYDINRWQECWSLNSNQKDVDLKWKKPVDVFWANNHPKLLLFCELDNFSILDTRDHNQKSCKSIMNRADLKYTREWERFRAVCPSPLNDHQFIIALDHKVIVVDSRYPQENLLQWNHMLRCDASNQIRLVNSRAIPSSSASPSLTGIITLTNKDQICLMSIENFQATNIVQPHSMHHPLHLSQPVDSWEFSSAVSEPVKKRLADIELMGMAVYPAPSNGYTVFQITNKGDIFAQDFYPKKSLEGAILSSWKRRCSPEDLELDQETLNMVDNALSALEIGEQEIEYQPRQPFISEQEQDQEVSDTNFIMPLPCNIRSESMETLGEIQLPTTSMEATQGSEQALTTTESLDSEEDSKSNSTNFCDQMKPFLNLIQDSSSLQADEYTNKLLEKWIQD